MDRSDNQDINTSQQPAMDRAAKLAELRQRRERLNRMTPEERFRAHRLEKLEHRQMMVGDMDLVAMALADPQSLDYPLRAALLDAPLWPGDETKFAKTLPGCKLTGLDSFERCASSPSHAPLALSTPAACKFALCDMRVSPLGEGDPVARVEAAYEEQLRLEREDAPLERARALVRSPELEAARYNARAILGEIEAAGGRGDGSCPDTQAIWDRIGPKHPSWVTDIAEGGEDYGMAILTTREAAARPRVALDQWQSVFNRRDRYDALGGFMAYPRVFGGETLRSHMKPLWIAPFPSDRDDSCPSERQPDDLRSQFKTRVERELLPNERYLRNTFLVLANDCIFPELDSEDVIRQNGDYLYAPTPPPSNGNRVQIIPGHEVPVFFLWAYDADWAPPEGGARADEDGYQGRVKVGLQSLLSWFYYARMTGVDMKALWRRSLELKDQVWTCEEDVVHPGNPLRLV